jgi:hypothetical protein
MSSSKKRKVVDVEWVQENVFDKISVEAKHIPALQKVVDVWQNKTDSIAPPSVSFRI